MKKERIIIVAIILVLLAIGIITILLININKEMTFEEYVKNLDYDISIVECRIGNEDIYPARKHYSYDYINTEKKEMYYSSDAYFMDINAEYNQVDGHTIIGPIKLTDYQIELVKSIFDDNYSVKTNPRDEFSGISYYAEYNGKTKHFTTLPINFKLWEEKEK